MKWTLHVEKLGAAFDTVSTHTTLALNINVDIFSSPLLLFSPEFIILISNLRQLGGPACFILCLSLNVRRHV